MTGYVENGSVKGPLGVPIRTAVEVRAIDGIVLPWAYAAPHEEGRGEVFIEWTVLDDLAEQDTYRSQIYGAFILDQRTGLALEQAGLAERETRGGYHRTDALLDLLKREGRV